MTRPARPTRQTATLTEPGRDADPVRRLVANRAGPVVRRARGGGGRAGSSAGPGQGAEGGW